MIYLPDVNLWLALSFQAHQHHPKANSWFSGLDAGSSLLFCRLTQQAFLRLATHPKVMGAEAVTLRDAWRLYDRILQDPRVSLAIEPPGLEQRWRALTQTPRFSPKVWNDAYLAAFALAGDYEMVTFDQGFTQFHLRRCTILA